MNSESNSNTPVFLQRDLNYLRYFYKFLIFRRTKELLVVGLLNFFVGLLPILLLILFETNSLSEEEKLQLYGDGSLIIFCFGVLATFITLSFSNFSQIFKTYSETQLNEVGNNNIILLVFCLAYYFFSYKIFEGAQTNFDRDWNDIYLVNGISIIFLIVAFFIMIYVKFSYIYDYSVINEYKEELKIARRAKKALKKNQSENIDL